MSTDTTSTFYEARSIRRDRSTKVEVEERREALLAIIDEGKPMTVRQVFYQATVRPRHRREIRGRLQQGADRPDQDAAGRIAAL